MTVQKKSLLFAVLLSLLASGCAPKSEETKNAPQSEVTHSIPKCEETNSSCIDEHTLQICVKDEALIEQVCAEGEKCDLGKCVSMLCQNERLDEGEEAVDCGGICPPCVACRVHADCGSEGFCDSAVGYVCSKRCRFNVDCANSDQWDGDFCRGDGRCSPKVFETVWNLAARDLTYKGLMGEPLEVREPTVEELTVVLPFDSKYPNATCDFQILWGDEPEGTDITTLPRVTDCTKLENRTHKYAGSGRYNVKIMGTYDGWGAFKMIDSNEGSPMPMDYKLEAVLSFGPVGLSQRAFFGTKGLHSMPVKDIPDASKLINLDGTFMFADRFDASIDHWDTSNVTDMHWMFLLASSFNQPIGAWDTSKVMNMAQMFESASAFSQDLSAWELKSGVDLDAIFRSSGMSNDWLCKLRTADGEWLKQWAKLGKTANCK